MVVEISECVTLTNTGRSIPLGRVDFIFLFSSEIFCVFPQRLKAYSYLLESRHRSRSPNLLGY